MKFAWSSPLALLLLLPAPRPGGAGAPPGAAAETMADTAALEFFGVRAGERVEELDTRLRVRGSGLRCDHARTDRRVTECRGRLADPRLGGPVDLWISAIDGAAAIITVSGSVAADQLAYWRSTIERRYGRVDARAQGTQWMMQWVRRGRMLRLTWRIERGARFASVSLVDGRILDRWGNDRAARPSAARP